MTHLISWPIHPRSVRPSVSSTFHRPTAPGHKCVGWRTYFILERATIRLFSSRQGCALSRRPQVDTGQTYRGRWHGFKRFWTLADQVVRMFAARRQRRIARRLLHSGQLGFQGRDPAVLLEDPGQQQAASNREPLCPREFQPGCLQAGDFSGRGFAVSRSHGKHETASNSFLILIARQGVPASATARYPEPAWQIVLGSHHGVGLAQEHGLHRQGPV